jgi:uncharacterized protein YggE
MNKFCTFVAALACAFSFSVPLVHAEQPLDTVSLTGTAHRTVTPDMANVTFSYETTGDTVEEVRQKGATMSTKVIAKLLSMGISQRDMFTSHYQVSPMYAYEKNGRQKLTGYRLYSSWKARINDLDQLGHVVDGVLSTGVNRVESVTYGVKQEEVYRRQLMAEAVSNARLNAQAIANAGGRGLGVLRQASISQSNFSMGVSPRLSMMAKSANDKVAETEFIPKPFDISVTVNTVFAMTLE